MKKIFSLFALLTVVVAVNATTPYKNLYVTAQVAPSGSGTVYLSVQPGEEAYVLSQSEDFDEFVSIQATIGENGSEPCTYAYNSKNPMYEVCVEVEPAAGYELVCLASKIKEDGVYYPEDCFAVFTSWDSSARSRAGNFDYTVTPEMGFIVNVNNVITHKDEDGNSSSGPSRDTCFGDSSKWRDTPDTEIYVIMRKKGESLPKVDLTNLPDYVDNTTDVSTEESAIHSYAIFCKAGDQLTLPVCMKNHGTEVAGVQFYMASGSLALETASEYAPSERATALDMFAQTMTSDSLKVAAYSTEAAAVTGEDGDIVAVTLYVPEDAANGNYDVTFSNVVLATPDGKAVKADDTTVSIIVGDYDVEGIDVEQAQPRTGRVFSITGVEMRSTLAPGLYIMDGKKILVR